MNNRRQQGLSLIELMVALAVGMLLLAGFLQIFMSVRSTYAGNEAASRVQENGRFALDILSQHARLAGYRDPKHLDRPNPIMPPNGHGCTAGGIYCSLDRDATLSATVNAENGDRIGFEYQPALTSAGTRLNCAGNTVGNEDVLTTAFYTKVTDLGNGQLGSALYCQSSKGGSDPVELVEGIDAIQVQYGVGPDNHVRRYVNAAAVADWNQVIAVRFAVLANSVYPVRGTPVAERKYYLLDTGPYEFDDDKQRQVFTTTVFLRNGAY